MTLATHPKEKVGGSADFYQIPMNADVLRCKIRKDRVTSANSMPLHWRSRYSNIDTSTYVSSLYTRTSTHTYASTLTYNRMHAHESTSAICTGYYITCQLGNKMLFGATVPNDDAWSLTQQFIILMAQKYAANSIGKDSAHMMLCACMKTHENTYACVCVFVRVGV